jgi:hypothetical protein
MVLPGVRTDPRTPGGMPDSGTVNPGGPMPSMPKMGPGPGPTAPGVPDPSKIEEIFDQYTSGQITRDDLINQLHAFSEGQGGILGLLEGMQQPEEGMQGGMPTMPGMPPNGMQPGQPPQPGVLPGSPQGPGVGGDPMIAPGAAQTPIPPLHEPLDARHQQISQMLQGFGLGPADADQMSTLLNPHEPGHKRSWSADEGLWEDVYEDTEKQAKSLEEHGGIAYDPTVKVMPGGPTDRAVGEGLSGSAAMEYRVQAGLGTEQGSRGAGYLDGQLIGDTSLYTPGSQASKAAYFASLNQPGTLQGTREVDWSPTVGGEDFEAAGDYGAEAQGPRKVGDKWFIGNREIRQTIPGQEAVDAAARANVETWDEQQRRLKTGPYKELTEEEKLALQEGFIPGAAMETPPVDASVLADKVQFNPFFGGQYDEEEHKKQWVSRGWDLSKGWPPWEHGFLGMGGENADLLPYWDEQSETWFPTQQKYGEYVEWQQDPDNQFYGFPGGEVEFSHYENATGHRVTQDSGGIWRLDNGMKYEGPEKGNLIGVPKNTRRVTVQVLNKQTGEMEDKNYNLPTYGFTETELIELESLMVNQGWIPWGPNGEVLTGQDAWQPGWGPQGYKKKTFVSPQKMKEFQLGGAGKTRTKGDELPEGWVFVDQYNPAEGGMTSVLYDADGNIVGDTVTGDSVMTTGLPKEGAPGRGFAGQDGAGGVGTGVDTGLPMEAGLGGQQLPEVGTDLSGLSSEQLAGLGLGPKDPWTESIMLGGPSGQYPMFKKFVSGIEEGGLSDSAFMTNIADVVGELELMTAKGDQANVARMRKSIEDQLVRNAAVKKEELDRDLKSDAALGEIAGKATLAAKMEDTANVFKAAAAAGVIPKWQDPAGDEPGKWIVPDAPGAGEEALPGSVEAQALAVTEQDKERQRELDFSTVFGTYVNLSKLEGQAGKTPDETMQTLEAQKFGLTKALANAEQTGIFDISATVESPAALIASASAGDQQWLNEYYTQGNPNDLHPSWFKSNLSPSGVAIADKIQQGIDQPGGLTGQQTLAAKRLAFEIDMGNRAADTADRLASIQEESNLNQTQVAQNRINIDSNIASGLLKEAVDARRDATWLATEGLRIQREKMKLDTLQSLQDPAAYLFAVRYGLLEQIGNVLGIDWGDDVITADQLPTMVAPGTFPSRQEFEGATMMDQRIMLAELASSQGFSVDQAALMILGGSPGGRQIKRPSILGAAR